MCTYRWIFAASLIWCLSSGAAYAQPTPFEVAAQRDTIEAWLDYVRSHKAPEEQYLRAHGRLTELIMEQGAVAQARDYLKEFDVAALDKRCEALDESVCGELLPGMLALELDFMERRLRDAEAEAELERLGPDATLSELLSFLNDLGDNKPFDYPVFYHTAHERVARRLAQEGSFTQLVEYLSWYEAAPEAHQSMCALLDSLTRSHGGKLATLRDAIRARQQTRGSAFDVDVSPVQRFLTAAHAGTADAWVCYLSHDDEGDGYDLVCALEAKRMLLGAAKRPLNAKQLTTLYTATADEPPTPNELAMLARTAQRMSAKEARSLAKTPGLPAWFTAHMACHDALAHEDRWSADALDALLRDTPRARLPQETDACFAALDDEREARGERARERERRRLAPTWTKREQEHLRRCRAARDVVVRERTKLERMARQLGPYNLPDDASEPLREAIERYKARVDERFELIREMASLGDPGRAERFNRQAQWGCAIPRSR